MSRGSDRLKRQREKKKLMGRIERNKKSIFGNTDLTPFNVGRRDWDGRNPVYK